MDSKKLSTERNFSFKELEAHLEEYKALRAEILYRIEAQEQLILYSILLIAAALPISISAIEKNQFALLLVIPIIFSSIAIRLANLTHFINILGSYIHNVLRPEVNKLLIPSDEDSNAQEATLIIDTIWDWEIYKHELFYSTFRRKLLHSMLGSSTLGIVLLPCIGALSAWAYIKLNYQPFLADYEVILLSIDIVALIIVILPEVMRWRDYPLSDAFQRALGREKW
jgi:ABC-type transport system involved in multi-copper enzyme maturation permease subunit